MMKLFNSIFYLLLPVITALAATQVQAAAGSDFGRLFSQPAERTKLDVLRQNQKLKVVTPQAAAQAAPSAGEESPELPEPIAMQGYLKRSDGSSTLWINGKAVQENSAVDNVEIGQLNGQKNASKTGSDSLNVKIPANGRHIRLKAGQVYEPETNQIKEFKLLEKEKRLRLDETGVIDDTASEASNSNY